MKTYTTLSISSLVDITISISTILVFILFLLIITIGVVEVVSSPLEASYFALTISWYSSSCSRDFMLYNDFII